jgi:hypothetical protein
MSIKQQVLDLAAEHGIELEVHFGELYEYIIGLPKNMLLPDGTSGYSGILNNRLSNYQNWKCILDDVKDLVERKDTWFEITDAEQEVDVSKEANAIDQLVADLKTTRSQKAKAGA